MWNVSGYHFHHILSSDTVTPMKNKNYFSKRKYNYNPKEFKNTKNKIQQASYLKRIVEMRMYENSLQTIITPSLQKNINHFIITMLLIRVVQDMCIGICQYSCRI